MAGSKCKFERVGPDAAVACARVFRSSRRHSLPYLPDLHTAQDDIVLLRRVLEADDVVAALDEERRVVGFIAYCPGWVNHLYVEPEWQGAGIGSHLLVGAQDAYESLSLWTFERNVRARKFYERHGFVATKQTDGSDNEEHEPDVLLFWNRPAVAVLREAERPLARQINHERL